VPPQKISYRQANDYHSTAALTSLSCTCLHRAHQHLLTHALQITPGTHIGNWCRLTVHITQHTRMQVGSLCTCEGLRTLASANTYNQQPTNHAPAPLHCMAQTSSCMQWASIVHTSSMGAACLVCTSHCNGLFSKNRQHVRRQSTWLWLRCSLHAWQKPGCDLVSGNAGLPPARPGLIQPEMLAEAT
jgi:hypothetical protein